MASDFNPSIAIHGGAGLLPISEFPKELQMEYKEALLACLDVGWRVIDSGGSAVDSVEAAVRALEDCSLFNAGKGSVLNEAGEIECDAAIMDGARKKAGAVAAVSGIKNPITLAREIMKDGRYVMLTGRGAVDFGKVCGLETVPIDYFIVEHRKLELAEAKTLKRMTLDHAPAKLTKLGTVGAVARDRAGNLAAATSTGGLTNKAIGRVSDSAIIGAGTYADNATCAISCTGIGEIFIREVVGHQIAARLRYAGQSLSQAVRAVVHDVLVPLGGVGGVIAVGANGEICLEFNAQSMCRAWKSAERDARSEIF